MRLLQVAQQEMPGRKTSTSCCTREVSPLQERVCPAREHCRGNDHILDDPSREMRVSFFETFNQYFQGIAEYRETWPQSIYHRQSISENCGKKAQQSVSTLQGQQGAYRTTIHSNIAKVSDASGLSMGWRVK